MRRRFHTVDVFTDRAFGGNPLAVFPDGDGLATKTMQAIAQELNLSETTFVLPPETTEGTRRVRIFTPTAELPFAGHPTLGTAYVIQRAIVGKQVEKVTLDLKAGMIPVTFSYVDGEADVLWMKQLNPVFGETHPPEPVAEFLVFCADPAMSSICNI